MVAHIISFGRGLAWGFTGFSSLTVPRTSKRRTSLTRPTIKLRLGSPKAGVKIEGWSSGSAIGESRFGTSSRDREKLLSDVFLDFCLSFQIVSNLAQRLSRLLSQAAGGKIATVGRDLPQVMWSAVHDLQTGTRAAGATRFAEGAANGPWSGVHCP